MLKSDNKPILNFFRSLMQPFRNGSADNNIKSAKNIWKEMRIWVMLTFGLILFFLLLQQISFTDFIKSISSVNVTILLVAFATGLSVTIIKSLRFEYFYPAPGRWLGLYGVFAMLRVLYYILPFNTGEIAYLTALKKFKFVPSISEVAPTWFFLRLTDIIALSIWFLLVMFLIPFTGKLFGEMYSFRWIIIGIASAMMVIILSMPFWIPKIKIKVHNNWFTQRIQEIQTGFSRTYGMKILSRTFIISLAIWFAAILFDTLALLSFNIPLSFMECFLASIAIYCISLLPINAPLNLGTDEALWTGVLMLAGITSTQSISIALSIRFVSLLVLITEGSIGFSLLYLRKNGD